MKRILLIEDDISLANMVIMMLSSSQVEIVWAKNGQDAIMEFEYGRFNLIVSDYNMPVMDGVQFIRELRTIDNIIPIILYTSQTFEAIRKLNRNHVHSVIDKLKFETLMTTVEKII